MTQQFLDSVARFLSSLAGNLVDKTGEDEAGP